MTEYNPDVVSRPSETIVEILGDLGYPQWFWHIALDMSKEELAALLNDELRISSTLATKLENGTGVPRNFWIRRFAKFEQWLPRQ